MFHFFLGMEDWDVVAPTEVATKQQSTNLGLDRSFLGSLTGVVSAHVGKTVSQVTKAMGRFFNFTIRCRLVFYRNGSNQILLAYSEITIGMSLLSWNDLQQKFVILFWCHGKSYKMMQLHEILVQQRF